jgi:hypothetical protein
MKKINNYRIISPLLCLYNGHVHSAIRSFDSEVVDYFLLVDIENLNTRLARAQDCNPRRNDEEGRYFKFKEFADSRYYKIVNKYNIIENNNKDNQGLKSIDKSEGVFISIDMCPSVNKIEKSLFIRLQEKSKLNKVYVSIAISGLWVVQNREDFIWLQSLKSDNFIITWINHSFTHRYYKDIAMENNFLLLSDTIIQSEILDTERILIEHGEIPSIFFRFPGLISDEKFLAELKKYGLVQLGSGAWISKMKKEDAIEKGNIILIHGNGNEERRALEVLYKFIDNTSLEFQKLENEIKNN